MGENRSPLEADDLRARVEKALTQFVDRQRPLLQSISEELEDVADAIEASLSGGKRMRPAFAYWAWRGAGGHDSDEIVKAVASLEFLQACALIHDDLMDRSATRRGQPSVHRRFASHHGLQGWSGSPEAFGSGAAILLGDLCLAWADECLYTSGLTDEALSRGKPTYDRMRTELMAGQYLDLLEQSRANSSVERAMRVARFKAAKYTVEGPLLLGAELAGASDDLLTAYSNYGLPLGEAFQLRDDLLGVFGDPETTGKPAGDDLREGKRTVLIAITNERSNAQQRELLDTHLGDPKLDSTGVEALRNLIAETGAQSQVEKLIDELAAKASDALQEIPQPAQSVLGELVSAATARNG